MFEYHSFRLYTKRSIGFAATLSSLILGAALVPSVQAAAKLEIDETKWISVGAGLRTSYNSFEDAAPSGDDRSNDFELDNLRLYINGQIHEYIKFEFNTERENDGDEDIRVLDGIAKFELDDLFNVWMGRFLPPSDRSNLSGPFYLNAWNFPTVQRYPAIFAGRDDGVAVWGQVNGGQFKYQAGLFEGRDGGSNQDDNLLFAGRLVYNFWDPEPGYYNSSTYYGSKDILAIGAVIMSQEDGAGTAVATGDFTGWNFDALMEKNLGGGVLSLEGAYFDYDLDDVADSSLVQGEGYFVLASYLFDQQLGFGKLQPMARFQNLDPDTSAERDVTEVGLNYIIDGHNARVSFVYGIEDVDGGEETDFVQLGVQLQI